MQRWATALLMIAIGCGEPPASTAPRAASPSIAHPIAAPAPAPVELSFGGGDEGVTSRRLAMGWLWSCALAPSRRVACWGRVPWIGPATSPIEIPELRGAVELVRASDEGVCARDGVSRVRCLDGNGQLTIDLGGARSIGAARGLVCGVGTDGALLCGDETGPVPLPGGPIGDALDARSAGRRVCVRRREGPVTCFEPLGPGRAQRDVLLGTEGAIAVGYHLGAACAAMPDHTIVCARAVADAAARTFRMEPIRHAPSFAPIAISGDDYDVCAINERNEAWCRQHDVSGERGIVDIALAPSGPYGPLCLAREGGEVACCGPNDFGQANGAVPTWATSRVPLGEPSIGLTNTPCALSVSGVLRCWGTHALAPYVERAPRFVEIASSVDLLCGRTARGEVWCGRPQSWVPPSALRRVPRADASLGLHSGRSVVAISARGEVARIARDGERIVSTRIPALAGASDAIAVHERVCAIIGTEMRCTLGRTGDPVSTTEGVARMLVASGPPMPVSAAGLLNDGSTAPRGTTRLCAWGAFGPLRCGDFDGPTGEYPHEVPEIRDVRAAVDVSAGGCAIDGSGDVWCWGGAPRADGTLRTVHDLSVVDLSVVELLSPPPIR